MSLWHIASHSPILIRWPKRDGHFASLEATEHVFLRAIGEGPICSGYLSSGLTAQSTTLTQYLEHNVFNCLTY